VLGEHDSVERFETRMALFVFKGAVGKAESLRRANVLNDVFDRIHHVFGPRKSMQRASPGRTSNSHTWFIRCSNHNCISILLVFFTDRIVQHDHLSRCTILEVHLSLIMLMNNITQTLVGADLSGTPPIHRPSVDSYMSAFKS